MTTELRAKWEPGPSRACAPGPSLSPEPTAKSLLALALAVPPRGHPLLVGMQLPLPGELVWQREPEGQMKDWHQMTPSLQTHLLLQPLESQVLPA